MDKTNFNVYIEQLRNGHQFKIDEIVSSDFLDVNEKELSFKKDVSIKGEAYLAGDMLILRLNLTAHGLIPCTICNDIVDLEIKVPDLYHAEPISSIKSGVFNFQDVAREALLLEVPSFAECKGKCPKRKEIAKYLKPNERHGPEEGYRPFKDLK